MAVLHDYICAAHGGFEAKDAHCPHGCSDAFVKKVFLQAPGITSARTKNIDGTLRSLAADYGLTDLNNQGGTSAVVRPDARKVAAREQLMGTLGDTSQAWGTIPGGKTGVSQAIAAAHAAPDNALESVKPILQPPKPHIVARHDAKIEGAT